MGVVVEHDGAELLIRVRTESHVPDALVAVDPKSLKAFGLEYAAILALARAGTLKTVWIGRRRYTRQSWLLALVDELPAAVATEPEDDIAVAAQKRAARRAAK